MRKMYYGIKACLILNFVILGNQLYAQQQNVTGRVTTTEDNTPLPGVNIVVKGTPQGTITDADGKYSIMAADSAKLVFSFIGYSSQEVGVVGKSIINVSLQPDLKTLSEVVVVGFGTQRSDQITSAVAHLKKEDFLKGPVRNVSELLAGKVAGLTVNRPSGDLTATPELSIRGVKSLLGNNAPLIIIDGVYNASLASLQPEDVETIDVLKDASASAIYGSQASGGVIIITTKSGKEKELKIDYNSWIGAESIAGKAKLLTGQEYRNVISENSKDNFARLPKAQFMQDFGSNTNWIDAITRTGVINSHNISASGGWNKSSVNGSLTYRGSDGTLKTTDAKNWTTRLNFTTTWKDRLHLNYSIQNSLLDASLATPGAWGNAWYRNPTLPIYNSDGSYYETENAGQLYQSNPLAALNQRTQEQKDKTLLINGKATLDIGWGLSTTFQYGFQDFNRFDGSYLSTGSVASKTAGLDGTAQISHYSGKQRTLNYTVDYEKRMGDHEVNGVVGYSYQDYKYQGNVTRNSGFYNDLFLWNNIGAGSSGIPSKGGSVSSTAGTTRLISFFGRVRYNYKSRYLFSASLRREGSSVFGESNRWAIFPAVSAGWSLHKENFLRNIKQINELKLRIGYGVTGTQPTNSNDIAGVTQPTMSALGGRFYTGGNWNTTAYAPNQNYNPYLKWESNKELNIGLDFSLFENKISGSLDYYDKKIENLIYNYTVPSPPNIYKNSVLNVGSMQNKGIELLVRGAILEKREVKISATLVAAYNMNKVLSLSNQFNKLEFADVGYLGDAFQVNTHRLEEGKAVGNFYGLKFNGFDQAGKWIFDSDGKSGTSATGTRRVIGNGIPKYTGGLTINTVFKSFDFSFMLRGAFKYQILNLYRMYFENKFQLPYNVLQPALSIPLYEIPKYSDYYLENGNYLKLDNLSIGYTYTPNSNFVSKMRVYVSGTNLYTLTKYSGLDPEVFISGLTPGIDGTAGNTQSNDLSFNVYPKTRIISVGISLQF